MAASCYESSGGSPENPLWVHNLRANSDVEIRDEEAVRKMRVREVPEGEERARLWQVAVAAFPNYIQAQMRTKRLIPSLSR